MAVNQVHKLETLCRSVTTLCVGCVCVKRTACLFLVVKSVFSSCVYTASTFNAMRKQTDKETLRLLNFTTADTFRGQFEKVIIHNHWWLSGHQLEIYLAEWCVIVLLRAFYCITWEIKNICSFKIFVVSIYVCTWIHKYIWDYSSRFVNKHNLSTN